MFRSLGKSKIAFVLTILFGLSLFFFRGGDRYSNLFNSDNVVASVSGTHISTSKFLRAMQMNINQYNQIFGRPLTGDEIQAFQIHSMALGQLVNNAVFENEFDTQNFIIDETVIASETKKRFPNLYNKNNKLNEIVLNSFLSKQNLKIDDLVKIIDYESRSNIFDKLFFEINYPNKMDEIINKHNKHIRNIDLVSFNIKDYQLSNIDDLDISISNNKIIDFFNQNINSYIDPEKRNISYIVINKNNYIKDFTPSVNQIENYYNNNKKLFLEKEKRDFIQFNFKNKKDASDFKNNIKTFNNDEVIQFAKDNNIFFNEFLKVQDNEVLENLSKVIFDLQEDKISRVVETALANHIIIVSKIYPEKQKTIDQSIKKISDTLLEVELDSYVLDLKNKINQQILEGYSLDEISKSNSLIIETIMNTVIQNNKFENDLTKSKVIEKGFSSNKDFVSDIVDVDENKAIIINVDQITYEKPYELDQIFDLVSSNWLKSLKITNIEKKVDEISNNKKSIEEISILVGVDIINIDIKLDNTDYPSALNDNIFENKINEISLNVLNDDVYISKINEISFPKELENSQITSMLSELRANFGAEIIKSKNISTNDSLIEALINQY